MRPIQVGGKFVTTGTFPPCGTEIETETTTATTTTGRLIRAQRVTSWVRLSSSSRHHPRRAAKAINMETWTDGTVTGNYAKLIVCDPAQGDFYVRLAPFAYRAALSSLQVQLLLYGVSSNYAYG